MNVYDFHAGNTKRPVKGMNLHTPILPNPGHCHLHCHIFVLQCTPALISKQQENDVLGAFCQVSNQC